LPKNSAKRHKTADEAAVNAPKSAPAAPSGTAAAAKNAQPVGLPESIGIDYLIRLARTKSAAARNELGSAINDLFLGKHDILSDTERELMNDILRHLIHEVEMSVRRDLAERLSHQPHAPHDLIKALANDQIEVAHSILSRSQVLHNLDLIEIVHHRTLEHQLAIAMRDSVPEDVADALVGTGQGDVIAALLENPNSKISRTTMEYLVDQSKRIDRFHNPLVARPDLGPDLAKKMYWWVSAALRQHIVENFDVDTADIDNTIESTVMDALRAAESDDPSKSKPFELADRLNEAKAITPELLIQVLRQGEINLFEALLVKLTGIRLTLARRVIFETGGEGLAVACRAVGIERREFAVIFVLSRRAHPGAKPVGPAEVAAVLDFFDRVDAATATAVLQRWRRDPGYLDSIRRIELIGGDVPPKTG
jgi:uncharacterized protein (DUF2336 family)